MKDFDQFKSIALKLLCDEWPCDPCRKLSINLSTLRDDKGNYSESAHYTAANRTGGSFRLGGMTVQKEFNTAEEKYNHFYQNNSGQN